MSYSFGPNWRCSHSSHPSGPEMCMRWVWFGSHVTSLSGEGHVTLLVVIASRLSYGNLQFGGVKHIVPALLPILIHCCLR